MRILETGRQEETMKRCLLLPIALSVASCLQGQVAASNDDEQDLSKFVGVWRGQFDNLPGVDMVISDEAGQRRGAILFYLHKRQDANSPLTSKPGVPEPLFDMTVEGQTLRFEVSHKRAHPPGSLNDPPVPFRLKLIAPDRAELVNESEHDGPQLTLTRSVY
jgi:hypothetical protein